MKNIRDDVKHSVYKVRDDMSGHIFKSIEYITIGSNIWDNAREKISNNIRDNISRRIYLSYTGQDIIW